MSHSYSRDKLEESRRRKRAQQAAQQQRVNLPSANSWRGVTPSQVAKPAQQTAPKTTAPKQNKTAPKTSTQTPQQNIQSAIRSGASYRGITPTQVTRNVSQPVVSLPVIHAAQERAQRVAQNDNTRRARAARAREGQRQAAQANAAALRKDRAALAANSLKWHQTSDAAERLRLEAENSAIRARRGYAYDSRTGSTFDSKGNELTLAARQIYGGRAETAKQFRDVAQTKDFVRDTSRTASQPSILDVARGVTADNPHYAIESGQKAHSIIASLLNRSGETWTDADTKARDEARDALQKEMQAIYQQYGATYQPRLSADETVKDLALRGADEQTLEYVRENLRLRDASDRLGQGLTAVGKRLEASIPSFVDTVKQAISNQSENKENEAFTRLEEQEKQLELQLQNMQSQDENGRVPADYQEVYDQLQRVREEKNSLKVEKGVDQNLWSQKVLREANEAQANAEAGLAPAPRWVAEQAISLASNAPTMAASAVPVVGPALGSLVMGAQAAGQRAFELNEQGKSAGEALGRGTVSGIIEAATEKLPLERMAEILHSGGANAVKNILRQMGTEATEEGVSYFLNYVSDLAAADPDAKFSLAELAQSAAGGAFGGLVFGTAGTVGAKLAQRNEGGIYDDTAYERDVVRSLQDADAQLRAARSMPEGAAREAAVSAAREKMSQTIADFVGQQAAESAERSAAYDADPNGRMSLAQRAQAAASLNQRTGQADAWQRGQVKPRLGTETEQRLESSYRTPEEENALQSQLAKHFAEERQVETGGVYDRATVERAEINELQTRLVNAWNEITDIEQDMHNVPYADNERRENARYYQLREEINQLNKALEARGVNTENIVPNRREHTPNFGAGNVETFEDVARIRLNDKETAHEARVAPEGSEGPAPIIPTPVKPGDKIRTWSRNNLGYALEGRGTDGDLSAWFANDTTTGRRAVHSVEGDDAMKIADKADYEIANESQRASAANESLDPSLDNSEYRNEFEKPKPLGNYEMYGTKTVDRTAKDLRKALGEKHSFSYDDDYRQARAQQSAELRETWEQARPIKEQIDELQKVHPLSAKDERLLQAALVNGASESFNQCDDPSAVMHRYALQQELNRRMQPVKDYQRARNEAMALNAEEMADTIAEFAKDKKIAGAYTRETMERNNYDIFGEQHSDKAKQLNDEFFVPVHKAVADKTNYVNTMREQVENLHLTSQESALVQMMLEDRMDVAAEYIKNNNIKVTSELQKHVADGVATFRAIYKELYNSINETLLANGMEPVRARKNYAPHFTKDHPDTILSRIRFMCGWGKDSSLNLPTDLAGITDDFSPGRKWFGNLLQRKGEITDYDAVAGFDRYIETAGDVIFLTDSVQQLRSLEDALRYRLSDEGTREKVNQIRNDQNLNALEKHQKIDEAYNSNDDNIQELYAQKKRGMGGYVSNLHEYINNLAGKKSRADRGWEELLGRQFYNVAKNMENRVAANMIGLNLSSWMTNFIPITQAGEISTPNLLRAMLDTVKSAIKDDGFTDGSVFLTNREGTQMLDQTLTQRISQLAGMPMECIDHFTANVVTRGKYLQNIAEGMSVMEAFDNADSYAASLMADRSKGAMPTAFNSVNPIRKVFTMFQLEVNNQLSYLAKDLPRTKLWNKSGNAKTRGAASLAWTYTKIFAGAYFFNQLFHRLTGRDSALDPIGMIADAFGIGDDDDKKKSAGEVVESLAGSIAENTPFIGGLLGGGRVPIASALPAFNKAREEKRLGYDDARVAQTFFGEALKPATYLLLPFGGGQIKKGIEGFHTVKNGGSYKLDKNGETIMQFPVYGQTPFDYAQAMLFGKSSLKTAQDWADNGYDTLNADETKAFDQMRKQMKWHRDENGNPVDNSEAVFAAIKAMRAISESNENRDVSAGQARAMLFNDKNLSTAQKEFLDKNLISGGQSGFYTSETAFKVSQMVRESRQSDAIEAAKHGISVELFAEWDEILQQANSDNLVDAADYTEGGDNKLYATNTLLANILNEYASNPDVSESEVNAFADYFIVSAMSKADREKWNDSVKGVVNASDYVKFKGDLAEYQKEFKGTGADNASNIASILDSYTNLSDEQKGVLMSTYTDSNKSNPFTVSDMEKRLKDNAFYKDLNDDGHTTLREYCNEYTQAIADGKNLTGWKAKAYMANEAGIKPEIYALFQLALKANDYDENGSYKSAEIEAAVKCIPGLTDKQRGYLWQAAKGGKTSKNNPWGATDVSKYSSSKSDAVNPVEGGTISSGFGSRSSFATSNGKSSSTNHKAIDIAAPAGTAVKAAMSGKITLVYKGDYGGYGNTVEIDHGNGIISKYHHMLDGSLEGLSVGQEVKAGQQIGKVGSTGNSTGPHLDFQVQKDGDFVDQRNYIPGYGAGSNLVYSGSASAGTIASGKSAASSSKKSSGSRKSGGSSGLRKPSAPKGLPVFR